MEDQYVTETLPVPPFVEGQPHLLIIGTFPPASSKWDYPFFFPNKQNRFWNTLARITQSDAAYRLPQAQNASEEVELRKQILHALDAAMVNIIRQCIRKNGSALDNDLQVLELENIVDDFLRPYPSISAIFLTSKSGKNSCLSLLRQHLSQQGIKLHLTHKAPSNREKHLQNPDAFSFTLDGREIKVYSLFSPSPTSLRAGISERALFQQYQVLRSVIQK